MALILFFVSIFLTHESQAGDWKFRAREHYEIHKVKTLSSSQEFKGFSNTINLWYEEPFKYSLGLGLGPIIGSAKPDEGMETNQLGSKLRLYVVNIEFKFFPIDVLKGLFSRLGAGWTQLESNGTLGNKTGYNGYIGVGYEFWVSKRFTIALEYALRKSELKDDVTVDTTTPSIGVHFYKDL